MTTLTRRQFLGAGAAGALYAHRALAEGDTFTIAALNDTHVKDAASVDVVTRAVEQINSDTRVRLVVALGDLGTDGAPLEMTLAQRALANLSCPWFAVPGNHDVALRDADILGNYRAAFGVERWVREQHGWRFIGFNSCEGAKSHVTVPEKELDWLREQAADAAREQPIALFCHHPLNPNTRDYRILNADEIIDVFRERSLRLVAAGHWHGNQVEEAKGALFTTTACCASTRNNFDNTEERGYRLFHLRGGAVETEFVPVPFTPRG